jgi:hypothetical protein
MLRVQTPQGASHVLVLLVSSVMENLAHVPLVIDHRVLGQHQFV